MFILVELVLRFETLTDLTLLLADFHQIRTVFVYYHRELVQRDHLAISPACEAAAYERHFVLQLLIWQIAVHETQAWVLLRIQTLVYSMCDPFYFFR
jgi:hypothetical protein